MTDDVLKATADHLRATGREDMARWLENPDAVRELLKHTPMSTTEDCAACGSNSPTHELGGPHEATCPVAAAWRALGDPRGKRDIERAHLAAIDFDAWRQRQAECPHRFVNPPAFPMPVRDGDVQMGRCRDCGAEVPRLLFSISRAPSGEVTGNVFLEPPSGEDAISYALRREREGAAAAENAAGVSESQPPAETPSAVDPSKE